MRAAAEISENEEQDGDDFSEYRKSLLTYADLNFKTGGVVLDPFIHSPLVKKLSRID
jgi:hypothetical protein